MGSVTQSYIFQTLMKTHVALLAVVTKDERESFILVTATAVAQNEHESSVTALSDSTGHSSLITERCMYL